MRRWAFLGMALLVAVTSGTARMGATSASAQVRRFGPVVQTRVEVRPSSGPVATHITVRGEGFWTGAEGGCVGWLGFVDAKGGHTQIGTTVVSRDGTFRTTATIPATAALGAGHVHVRQDLFDGLEGRCRPDLYIETRAPFTVTG